MDYLTKTEEKEIRVFVLKDHELIKKERRNLSEILKKLKIQSEMKSEIVGSISNKPAIKVTKIIGEIEEEGISLYFSLCIYLYLNPESVLFWLNIGNDREWMHPNQ